VATLPPGAVLTGYLTTHRAECSSSAIKTFTVRHVGPSVIAARAGHGSSGCACRGPVRRARRREDGR